MLLLENGHPIADSWTEIADDAPPPAEGQVVLSLARFLAERGNAGVGVRIGAKTTPEELTEVAARAAMVVVDFPASKDGRGFSLARRLRERHGFKGEIRAAGHILPDNYMFMKRCGFTTAAVADDTDLRPWQIALTRFAKTYQVTG